MQHSTRPSHCQGEGQSPENSLTNPHRKPLFTVASHCLTSTPSRWPSVFTAARERLAYLRPTLLTQWSVLGDSWMNGVFLLQSRRKNIDDGVHV